jgi:hypothetical protein
MFGGDGVMHGGEKKAPKTCKKKRKIFTKLGDNKNQVRRCHEGDENSWEMKFFTLWTSDTCTRRHGGQ